MESLQLSDIIHTASPEPSAVINEQVFSQKHDMPEPELLTETEIIEIRCRVAEIVAESPGQPNPSAREQELVKMVLRLTEPALIDPSQLMNQAAVISGLTAQRDYLLQQAEEERGRWLSEKDGWDRMAEALIARHSALSSSGPKDPEIDRISSAFEAENRALRDKLHDTQSRLSSLESELVKLKPLLLMQPLASSGSSTSFHRASAVLSSLPYPALSSKTRHKKKKLEPRSLPNQKPVPQDTHPHVNHTETPNQPTELEPRTTPQLNHSPMMEGVEPTPPSFAVLPSAFFQFQAAPTPLPNVPKFSGDHYRKPQVPPIGGPLSAPPTTLQFQLTAPDAVGTSPARGSQAPPHPVFRQAPSGSGSSLMPGNEVAPQLRRSKSRRLPGGLPAPLTSDARAEHLLLAAHRIGRERAAVVAGFVKEKGSEKFQTGLGDASHPPSRSGPSLMSGSHSGLSPYYREVGQRGPGGIGSPQTPKSHPRQFGQPSPHVATGVGVVTSPLAGPSRTTQAQGMHGAFSRSPVKGYNATGGYLQGTGTLQQHSVQGQGQANPPSTPLSSLLDAARMMDPPQTSEGTGVRVSERVGADSPLLVRRVSARDTQEGTADIATNGGSGKGKTSVGTESSTRTTSTTSSRRRVTAVFEQSQSPPAPKRRRVSTARALAAMQVDEDQGGEMGEGIGRVRSALDVLADQAAAAVGQDRTVSRKGKAREVETVGGVEEKEKERKKRRPGRGRGRGVAQSSGRVRGKEGVNKEAEAESKSGSRTKIPRPPPRRRGIVSPSPDDIEINTSISKAKAGVATPRIISPPARRKSAQRGSALTLNGQDEENVVSVSSLDMVPPSEEFLDEGYLCGSGTGRHTTPLPLPNSKAETTDMVSSPTYGFTPVTAWTAGEAGGKERTPPSRSVGTRRAQEASDLDIEVIEHPSTGSSGVNKPAATAEDALTLASRFAPDPQTQHTSPPTEGCFTQEDVSAFAADGKSRFLEAHSASSDRPSQQLEDVKLNDVERASMAKADVLEITSPGHGTHQNDDAVRQAGLSLNVTESGPGDLQGVQDAARGDQVAQVDENQDLPDIHAPGDRDMNVDAEADIDADADAGNEKQKQVHRPQERQLDDETSPLPEINGNAPAASTETTGPLPSALSGADFSQSHEPDCGDNDPDIDGDADEGSEADAEGEVDVDAEGELDPEVESPTIISSLAKPEPEDQPPNLGYFEPSEPLTTNVGGDTDCFGSQLQEPAPRINGSNREESDILGVVGRRNSLNQTTLKPVH